MTENSNRFEFLTQHHITGSPVPYVNIHTCVPITMLQHITLPHQ